MKLLKLAAFAALSVSTLGLSAAPAAAQDRDHDRGGMDRGMRHDDGDRDHGRHNGWRHRGHQVCHWVGHHRWRHRECHWER